ncbi:hypothetical protein, partial [Neisseria dentiae]|uniref:hypothetical protein n=1 Tax=Neisseria dentiae TaxID=194197 RepID=UPI0035A069A4
QASDRVESSREAVCFFIRFAQVGKRACNLAAILALFRLLSAGVARRITLKIELITVFTVCSGRKRFGLAFRFV